MMTDAVDNRKAVAGVLARVDRLLAEAVRVATATFGAAPAADPFRGLYVSDADAARTVGRGVEPLGQHLPFDFPLVDLDVAGPRWQQLARAFALSALEVDVVALALPVEVDLRYERVFGYLHDDVTRRRPSVDLVLQLLSRSFEERLAHRRFFLADAALTRCGILRLIQDANHPDPSSIGYGLKLEDDVVDFLLGKDTLPSPSGALRWDGERTVGDGARALADRLIRRMDGSHVLLTGLNEREKLDISRAVAVRLDLSLLIVDLERLVASGTPIAAALLLVVRTARLRGAVALWTHGEVLDAAQFDAWLAALGALNTPLTFLATTETQPKWLTTASRFIRLDCPVPGARERGAIWSERLEPLGLVLDAGESALLAEAFRFDAESIDRAVDRAWSTARWRDIERPQVSGVDVFAGARAEAARILPRYATRLEACYGWDDIVLPPDQLRQLCELCARVRHRRMVLDEWGFARRLPLGTGTAALFAGPSGTGKTMAAQVIAAALGGLELYRVEIPAVVSKYIGDTEKALDQLFREAQGTSAILLFDEADALFGKRTEVKDAHDRYANIEVAYLLQALEAYEGLTILATNFRHNMDDAFVRRLAFIVDFPYPEEAERRQIWARGWPTATPLALDLDIEFLARQFKLTGGDIRNAALAAAFGAVANGGRVTMAHVIRGVGREYQKLGRVCAESDFGPYFELLA